MASYTVEYHRVWVKTIEADNREQARQIVEEEMSEDPDAEDRNYSIVKRVTSAHALTESSNLNLLECVVS